MNNKYHIIVIGCQMNKSDSERIAGYLEERNFIQADKKEADLIIMTTCGIRQSAENKMYGFISQIKKNRPEVKIVLTGCLSNRADVQKKLKNIVDVWLPITELESLGEKLGLEKKEENSLSGYLSINPKHQSAFSAFVPIGNGCDNFCTYCVVPHARGREKYRAKEEILSEVRSLIKRGYKEITLIAQNVNSYKVDGDNSTNFSDLLRAVNDIEGNFWIRFSTSHPKDMSEKLIRTVAECDKVCEHIHLPAQSGDNEILRAMNRKYTREHYFSLIKKIREIIPGVSITTDIIVGFPGESEDKFKNTVDLFKKGSFDMAYISQYSSRPGTAAALLGDDITLTEKDRRDKKLTDILKKSALSNNKAYLGGMVDVLIERKKRDLYIGKTRTAKIIRIKDNKKIKIGDFIKVKIIKIADFGMEGEVI